MINREPTKIMAHLWYGKDKIPVEAKYASRFSLSVRFLNGYETDQETTFRKLVFEKNDNQVEIGPCQFMPETDDDGYRGRLVFSRDVYDLNSLFFENKLEKLQAEFFHLPLILSHKDKINPSFKEYTANLTYDLNVYKNLFDTLDARYAGETEEIKKHVQAALIETEGRKFMKFLDQKLDEFENVIIDFSRKEHERHGYYFRRQLWSFLMCSPFMTRTNLKPRGYSGDSIMMKMIYNDKFEGDSTFGKLMHKHPIEHPAAQAVRNRRDLIAKILGELKARKLKGNGQKIKILSVACGPAFELQDVITSTEDCARFHFTLLDQDENALDEARNQIAGIEKKLGAEVEADYLNESVRTLLKTAELSKRWGNFDYIYSMGLFDYLTPPVAKAVMGKLYQILNIGGEMAIGNFHISNASRYYMEYWLDWVLYYRTEHDFIDLLRNAQSAKSKILFEDTGSQMFLHVTKSGK
ncbi:MAG: class I SAM-dependent methyltransferase [Desulfobacterales bacterium]|nr:class I SAM-dependent methyltransferase [Desulfobacterales bacterium]